MSNFVKAVMMGFGVLILVTILALISNVCSFMAFPTSVLETGDVCNGYIVVGVVDKDTVYVNLPNTTEILQADVEVTNKFAETFMDYCSAKRMEELLTLTNITAVDVQSSAS